MNLGAKEKKQLAIVGALVLVLLLMIGRAVSKYKQSRRFKQAIQPIKTASMPPTLSRVSKARTPIIPPEERENIYEYLQTQTTDLTLVWDPFFNQSLTPTDDTPQLLLKGIAWDETAPTAIINDDVVAPGDVIAGGIEVVTIEEYTVHLLDGEKEFTLSIAIE